MKELDSLKNHDIDGPCGPETGLFGLPCTTEEAQNIIISVPFEGTCSMGKGTRQAPSGIFFQSHYVELFHPTMGEFWRSGIAMDRKHVEALTVRLGNNSPLTTDQQCEALNTEIESRVAHWLDSGKIVGLVGGEHSVSYGAIAAQAKRHPGMGILHVDAHADLRAGYDGHKWSHASVMYNVVETLPVSKLVSVGIRDFGKQEYETKKASGGHISWHRGVDDRVLSRIGDSLPKEVYVSIDIDGLDPSLCPNTGTPVPGGLSYKELISLLIHISVDHKIVGFDLVEVGGGEWDCYVGAKLLYELIGRTMFSQGEIKAQYESVYEIL